MAYFYVTVGDQKFTVSMDSGSSDLVFPLAACDSCIGPGLNDTSLLLPYSKTECQYDYDNLTGAPGHFCGFNVTYGGSMTLANIKGVATVGLADNSVTVADTTFGGTYALDFGLRHGVGAAVTKKTGVQYENPPQGVAGFAFPALAESKANPLWMHWAKGGKNGVVFGHCFAENGEGGMMTLGGSSPYGDPSTLTTVNVTARDFWRIEAFDTLVDGKSIGVPSPEYNANAIVDSGTPFVTMPTPVFQAFSKAFAAAAPNATLAQSLLTGQCVNVTDAEVAALPAVDFLIESVRPGIPSRLPFVPTSYIIKSSTFCQYGGSILTLSDGGDGFFVLGSAFLRQFAVSYFNPGHGSAFMTFERAVGCPSHKN
jgi:hypothetical protein